MVNVRTFRDINGIEWHVAHANEGWLSFTAGHLERRLTPVPTNWQTATVQRLEQMCRIAQAVQQTETSIASAHSAFSSESAPEGTVDTTPAEGADVVVGETAVRDHMSLLANTWPASQARITFRG